MDTKIISFPADRSGRRSLTDLPRDAIAQAATVVSLDRWKGRPRPHRTANGVFFMTRVLVTPGDFA